jgi:hypothetical protein
MTTKHTYCFLNDEDDSIEITIKARSTPESFRILEKHFPDTRHWHIFLAKK